MRMHLISNCTGLSVSETVYRVPYFLSNFVGAHTLTLTSYVTLREA
jgi:hypothetical protein